MLLQGDVEAYLFLLSESPLHKRNIKKSACSLPICVIISILLCNIKNQMTQEAFYVQKESDRRSVRRPYRSY